MKLGARRFFLVTLLFLLGSVVFSQVLETEPNDSPTDAGTITLPGLGGGVTVEFFGVVAETSTPNDTVDYWNVPDSAAWFLDTSFSGNLRLESVFVFPTFSDYRIELRRYMGATRATAVLDTSIIIPRVVGSTVLNINRRHFFSVVIKNLSGNIGAYALRFSMTQGAPNGSGSIGLPVEWLSFEAMEKDQNVQLAWSTAAEENNRGFYVERSQDAEIWEELGFVEGAGTTEEIRDYAFTDRTPSIGYNYYRIRQVDFNGDTDYSDIREIILDPGVFADALKIFPNPATDILNISPFIGIYTIRDLQGRILASEQLNGTWTEIPVMSFAQGTYLLELRGANQDSQVLRFIKR